MSHNDPNGELSAGELLPAFTLPAADGMPYSPLSYKQREHLLLLFLEAAATPQQQQLLTSFARRYADFRAESCALLAITTSTVIANWQAQEILHLPFPLLADPQRTVSKRYLGTQHTSLVFADRYNEIQQQWLVEYEADLPPIPELLASLAYLNTLCTP